MIKTLEESLASPHKYLLLAEYFREQIHSGALKAGERLPSFGHMQAKYGVGQATLEKTYALLEDERIIVREAKRGTFVAEPKSRREVNVIGIVPGPIPLHHPYYTLLLQGIYEVAHREKIEILMLHDASTVKWEKMDGVILAGLAVRLPQAIPVVNLLEPLEDFPSVVADDYNGAKAATQHLISLGHRKIAYLPGGGFEPHGHISEQRMKGYRDALREAGIRVSRLHVRALHDPWTPERQSKPLANLAELGFQKMSRWLREDWQKLGCTAILAQNDESAIGMIRALQDAGLNVPNDVSVMGFDGTEISEYVQPSLSTVVVPLRAIGAKSLELLLQQIDTPVAELHERVPPKLTVLPTRLKLRASTARPPEKS